MPIYPEPISRILENLAHCGSVPNASALGRAANFECGGFIHVSLEISGSEGRINTIRYKSNGCGFMLAAAEIASSEYEGARLADLDGMTDLGSRLRARLGNLGMTRWGCVKAVEEALRASFKAHRDRLVEEFAGEKALICTCFGVSEESLLRFIETSHPSSVDDVSSARHAGSGCGSCRMLIQELLDSYEI